MNNHETRESVYEIIISAAKKCVAQLHYTQLSSPEVNFLIDKFHKQFGETPTFEQIKEFNDQIGGVNCTLYAEAAIDLLRSNGVVADKVNLLNPYQSKGPADNHAVVRAANIYWLEPQTGECFRADDWDSFAEEYAKLLNTDPTQLIAYCPRNSQMWFGSNWKLLE